MTLTEMEMMSLNWRLRGVWCWNVTFEVGSRRVSRRARRQSCTFRTGLLQSMKDVIRMLCVNIFNHTSYRNIPERNITTDEWKCVARQNYTCWEMLETLLVLRRSVSLWHTVSSELGKMERKSLNERRLTDSGSSEAVTGCADASGYSLDSRGSSVLL